MHRSSESVWNTLIIRKIIFQVGNRTRAVFWPWALHTVDSSDLSCFCPTSPEGAVKSPGSGRPASAELHHLSCRPPRSDGARREKKGKRKVGFYLPDSGRNQRDAAWLYCTCNLALIYRPHSGTGEERSSPGEQSGLGFFSSVALCCCHNDVYSFWPFGAVRFKKRLHFLQRRVREFISRGKYPY